MYFSVYLFSVTYIHNQTMTWIGSSSYMHMWRGRKISSEWNRVLGVFWAPLCRVITHQVNFHSMLIIQTVLGRGHYYLHCTIDSTILIDSTIRHQSLWFLTKFKVLWVWSPVSKGKIKIGDSNKDQHKGLEKFYQNMPKTKIWLSRFLSCLREVSH